MRGGRIKGESDVDGGGGHGWVEAREGSAVGAAVWLGALAPGQRWSASRKRDVVLRLLRGESLDAVSREVGVEVYRLEAWKARALAGLERGLKAQAGEPLAAELDAAKRHIFVKISGRYFVPTYGSQCGNIGIWTDRNGAGGKPTIWTPRWPRAAGARR